MTSFLLKKSILPYQAPDFSKIDRKDFEPAMLQAMELQQKYINEIVENEQTPTFENTLLLLEKSGEELLRVSNIFYALASAHTDTLIQEAEKVLSPLLANHKDAIFLNEKLFQRVKTLYNQRESLHLEAESLRLLTYYYDLFLLNGANLSDEKKKRLREVNASLASLTNKFSHYTMEARNEAALILTQEDALAGLSTEEKNALKADNSWKINILNTTQQPLLASLENEETRKRLFDKSWNRASSGTHATDEIVKEIIALRKRKAALLGYDNYAQWSLQHTMAKNPDTVMHFLEEMMPFAFEKVQKEVKDLKDIAKKEEIFPYNWDFYAEKVRKTTYDLDENELKPYFELFTVLEKGVFHAATSLYGISFRQRTDLPVYHPDVKVYELLEEDGSPLGLFYVDFYARPEKKGGAWMSNIVTPSQLLEQKPVIYNVCNYNKPADNHPCLLTFSEVETLFHEFGHALHAFFAEQKYPSLAGTAVARDFVEFPSQFNENWALYPDILQNYAVHHHTKEPIPSSLIDKIKNSRSFNQGYAFTEVLSSAYLDMKWHTLPSDSPEAQVEAFEKDVLSQFPKEVPPRYRSNYFSHIFAGGYAAGYYSYQYAEMLSCDAYRWFEQNGGLTRENGELFRKKILSKGNTMDYKEMYKDFAGRLPSEKSLLQARGLLSDN